MDNQKSQLRGIVSSLEDDVMTTFLEMYEEIDNGEYTRLIEEIQGLEAFLNGRRKNPAR